MEKDLVIGLKGKPFGQRMIAEKGKIIRHCEPAALKTGSVELAT